MRNRFLAILVGICAFAVMTLVFSADSFARKKRIVFGGGPAGGTFQVVANGIQVYKPVKALKDSGKSSEGELRKTTYGRRVFGPCLSGPKR
jgi:hypothetical protein